MITYPKINSLWKREGYDPDNVGQKPIIHKLVEGDYSCPEFANIIEWQVSEKVDGTNIRIFFDGSSVKIGGRTKDAQLPTILYDFLVNHFTLSRMQSVFGWHESVMLFGEGYGAKIQGCGSLYRKDNGFILFDVKIGEWWLKQDDVIEIAKSLGLPSVPDLGIMKTEKIVEFVKAKPISHCSYIPQHMEGIVARAWPMMLFRNGEPIMWKLKAKEFF